MRLRATIARVARNCAAKVIGDETVRESEFANIPLYPAMWAEHLAPVSSQAV